ncbi:hypothetical protein DSO57_1000044 [Entomophthora muscae]|uniref:Uncharacterized protein n=1 Tax=Entomophthora muscae TaxID=34485 RepID=A0ACC2SM25_9FUNG|nr:hypothetical protein DSO57_1000044 [Entomophthora muscae]
MKSVAGVGIDEDATIDWLEGGDGSVGGIELGVLQREMEVAEEVGSDKFHLHPGEPILISRCNGSGLLFPDTSPWSHGEREEVVVTDGGSGGGVNPSLGDVL